MKPAHLLLSLAWIAAATVACSSSSQQAKEPESTSPVGAPPAASPSAAPAETAAGPSPSSAGPAGASSGTLTIGAKTMPIESFELQQDGAEFYFYAKAANREGVGLMLGANLAEGAKISKDRGVTGHILENDSILNVGDSSKMTFELTKMSLGTWEKQGKCSGKFTAETTYKSTVIKASGTFEGAPCYKL